MPPLQDAYRKNAIIIGNHIIDDIVKINGLDDLPDGIGLPRWHDSSGIHDANNILSLELPSIQLTDCYPDSLGWLPNIKILGRRREFYLCFSAKYKFLFVVETEMRDHEETSYRAQYGANDNYDTSNKTQRMVWIYSVDSPRAKEAKIAEHLKPYLP